MRGWTLFLDRDGVINRHLQEQYVRHWGEFQFEPGALEALAFFAGFFGRIFIATNQQGVGKGLMSLADLDRLHQRMLASIETSGGRIDQIYVSPHLAEDPQSTRKPLPALAWQAQTEFPEVDFHQAIMVGDSASDILFGKNLGMTTVRIVSRHPSTPWWEDLATQPDHTFPSLWAMAQALAVD